MSSVKKIVGCVLAGAVVSVSLVPVAQATANLAINDEAQLGIQTPLGFTYVSTGASSTLNVQTDGYAFCANVYPDTPPTASAAIFTPTRTRWTLPSVVDVQSITYADGILRVNKPLTGLSIESTLVCQTRGAQGDISRPFSAYGEWLFRDGMEQQLSAATQYANMTNWIPPAGFSWAQSGAWDQVPADPCNFDMGSTDTPLVAENSLCAAATGVRPAATAAYGVRAPTMWTQASGSSFIYLARIDARLGSQATAPNSSFRVVGPKTMQTQGTSNSVTTEVRDGFDSDYLSSGGTFCLLSVLPTSLTSTVCDGAVVSGPVHGTLQTSFPLSLFPSAPIASFYVAVVRTINPNSPPTINTPVAAMAVLGDPGTVRHDAGDEFTGDNVVFGFPDSSGAFSWANN